MGIHIFDLDGTLALTHNRNHFLDDKKDPERWDKFYKACDTDRPNFPILHLLCDLAYMHHTIWIWTGRRDEELEKTVDWLRKFGINFHYSLVMRPKGDFTKDHILKKRWYDELTGAEQLGIECVYEDRTRVVNMWRSLGLTCLQVADGDF
jgi:hypothetical protein